MLRVGWAGLGGCMPGPRKSRLISTLELDHVEGTGALGLGFWVTGCWGTKGSPIVCSGCKNQKKFSFSYNKPHKIQLIKNSSSSMLCTILHWKWTFANSTKTLLILHNITMWYYQDSCFIKDRNVGREELSSTKIISACLNASQAPLIIPWGGRFFLKPNGKTCHFKVGQAFSMQILSLCKAFVSI